VASPPANTSLLLLRKTNSLRHSDG